MRIHDGKAEDLRITYIGGGSRGWAWKLMSDLAEDASMNGTVTLYDIDKDAAHKNEIIGNAMRGQEGVAGAYTYRAVDDLREALAGADIVVISILPGTFEEMESDVHAPEAYGIYQSVGDTTGPGGVLRALRTLPMYIEFAQAIRDVCPGAWVINYTNPMAVCIRTLYRVFPQIKAFGCCHEVFNTQKLIASLCQDAKGRDDIDRSDIKVSVLGLNHFTWITAAAFEGEDLFPMYREAAEKYAQSGYTGLLKPDWEKDFFAYGERVKFDLFRRYGYIAAAGDRHLAEFCPPWYLKDPATVKEWMFGLTPVSWRKENRKKLLERSERLASGKETFALSRSGEEGVRQIKALLGLGDFVTNVNMPNRGQVANMPEGTVVETNALFAQNRVVPLYAGKMPEEVLGLTNTHILAQKNIDNACATKSFAPAFHAFLTDPLVPLSMGDARALFGKMIDNTSAYLDHYTDRTY